ncbi:hypothetical protein F9B85_07685 [Heliorestis acidaminivorans]|uniref:Uncharacterized protein n=1 Tax=Heliorestis acidaminivorans TaxID=553427 RepID=A0A6I0F5F0_9FIRM|nr:hypothetical protein [Heliorestis acidaminivorans]KAB2952539.1 hypothetical protein F9B85_07685 [Heliorestis acidaminivorans]
MRPQTQKAFFLLLGVGFLVPTFLLGYLLNLLLQEMNINLVVMNLSIYWLGLFSFFMLVIVMTSLYFITKGELYNLFSQKTNKKHDEQVDSSADDQCDSAEISSEKNPLVFKENHLFLTLLQLWMMKQTTFLKGTVQIMDEEVGQQSHLQEYSRRLQELLMRQEQFWQEIYNGLLRQPSFSWTNLKELWIKTNAQAVFVESLDELSAKLDPEALPLVWTDGEKVKLALSYLKQLDRQVNLGPIEKEEQYLMVPIEIIDHQEKNTVIDEELAYLLAFYIFCQLRILLQFSKKEDAIRLLLAFPLEDEKLWQEKGGWKSVINNSDHC